MSRRHRILAFHLLNDRSGSPKVLSQLLVHWVKEQREVHLFTSNHQNGFLSGIEGITYHKAWYVFQSNPCLRLICYVLSQMLLILKIWSKIQKDDVVYINTVLPFGAAIVGKLKKARVIYHIHESTVKPKPLKWFLFKMVEWTASDIINVSQYVEHAHQIKSVPNHLVYNAIENVYLEKVLPKSIPVTPKNVLMVCSLKAYKGVFEFLQLARDNPQYFFRLALNASEQDLDLFFKDHSISPNLSIYGRQKDLHPFYQWADVIVNLSRPDGWVETFGLTIIEGMAYGLPAIVPPVGGILEVIHEGTTAFAIDSRERSKLNQALSEILKGDNYNKMSSAAKSRLAIFKEITMMKGIDSVIQNGNFNKHQNPKTSIFQNLAFSKFRNTL